LEKVCWPVSANLHVDRDRLGFPRFAAKNRPDPRYCHIARFKFLDWLHAGQPVVVGRDFQQGLIVRLIGKGGLRFEFHRVPPSCWL